ncbi:hypothetical protein DFH06DRAFT_1193816 [Mycena polygramma]|nr:hypothetical protein DFH06DRAFT_1193816 [Mycena polygramma]
MLLNVDEDVLLYIFALTDLFTVLSLSRVNKSFHAIVSSKQLWISILRDLYFRRLIDPVAGQAVETLSKDAIIDEIKRAVVGPRTWSPDSLIPPTIHRQIIVPLDDTKERRGFELLPGGKHMLFYVYKENSINLDKYVECREVSTGRLVWEWERPDCTVTFAGFNVLDSGKEAVAYVMVLDSSGADHTLVLKVNMDTGEARERLKLPRGSSARPQICGDLFFSRHSTGRATYGLLMNWRTREFIIVDCEEWENLTIVPGHVLATKKLSRSAPHHLYIFSLANLVSSWRPLDEFDWKLCTDLKFTPSTNFALPKPHANRYSLQLFVAESPLNDYTYELIVECTVYTPPSPGRKPFIGFRLTGNNTKVHPKTAFRYRMELPAGTSVPKEPSLHSVTRYPESEELARLGEHYITTARKHCLTVSLMSRFFVRRLNEAGINNPMELPQLFASGGDRPNKVHIAHLDAVVALNAKRAVITYFV